MRALPGREDRWVVLPSAVDAYLTAYSAKDVDAMLACLADGVWFQDRAGGAVTAETWGKRDFESLARQGAAAFNHRNQTVLNAITIADTTLVEIAFSAVVAKDLPNGWKAGRTVALMGTSLFLVTDDGIVRLFDQRD